MSSSHSVSIPCSISLDGKVLGSTVARYSQVEVNWEISKPFLSITLPSSLRIMETKAKPARLELSIHSCNTLSKRRYAKANSQKSGARPNASSSSPRSTKLDMREIELLSPNARSLILRLAREIGGTPPRSPVDSVIKMNKEKDGIYRFLSSSNMGKTTGKPKRSFRK